MKPVSDLSKSYCKKKQLNLSGSMRGAGNNFILKINTQIIKIVGIAGHTHNQITV